jgi:ABC-type dipeptide/oligopeptide/nickel transport system permease subunit
VPSIAHILYIPGIFLIGLALGFKLGAKAARAELERRQRQRRQ